MNLTSYFIVAAKLKPSKARFVTGLEVGDVIKVSNPLMSLLGHRRNRNHPPLFHIYKYIGGDMDDDSSYELISRDVTQNEFYNFFGNADVNVVDDSSQNKRFLLKQLSIQELHDLNNNQ